MRYRTQAVAYPYFVVALLLYGLQMVFGILAITKYLGPDPIKAFLPFDVSKEIHTNLLIVWVLTGPIFKYSDTWQLVINTGTTIVTFLMVFLIQNTQNRDTLAIQLKLSELVLAMKGAENKFAAIEDLSDEELEQLHNDCRARADMTRQHIEGRKAGSPKPVGKPRSKTPAGRRQSS